ncbi:hypothetical protein BBJ29_004424 [Phytophthora kernoviae]|uniref:Translin-associated factor X-interacting protein 1 N-terminal domain-containing protein n=1 Tax=Phytophthora kernoviae TaxID=325452 RepID=A0A3F2RNW6_9STRA|nr:hypothetical protein BBJ29_004424 [Phytophthora kernoviae]RLN61368.1 hypothetical protein BBP00_00005445 [Phytophthora kernoviae]
MTLTPEEKRNENSSRCPPEQIPQLNLNALCGDNVAGPSKLEVQQLETVHCFKLLEAWQESVGVGPLKNLLTDVYKVLYDAAYREPEPYSETNAPILDSSGSTVLPVENITSTEKKSALEYFSLVAEVQEKVKLKQAERKRLSTQLDMENSLQHELSEQLNQLENELTQLHARHVYNRAEIETERLVLRRLEKDYASLTEEEMEALRDCEVLELQLETERMQLKELRSQQLYLDFVSSAPLNCHMEEKKWQEQHANVTLQVQNTELENRMLEDRIKGLEDQVLTLEAQYKLDVEKMVRKVWVEKRKREQRNPLGRFPLEQVLYEKLHRKYGFQPLIAEWGYNLLLALQSFSWDTEIEMFLLCLTGGVSDLVYLDQEQMIQGCQQILLQLCELYNVESFASERRVLLKDALVGLRTFFPLKTPGQLQAIEQAIIRDMHKMKRGGNDSILYVEDILPLDVKYPLGFFVKTIRTQHFKEIQDYYALLLSELEQRDTEQKGILPLSAVRDAILTIDPFADQGAVYNRLMKAMHVKIKAHLYMREPVHYKAILKSSVYGENVPKRSTTQT